MKKKEQKNMYFIENAEENNKNYSVTHRIVILFE